MKKKNPLEYIIDRNEIIKFDINKDFINTSLNVAIEGTVLLKNDNNCLPLRKDSNVTVFGRCAVQYFYCGYGSGGEVPSPYVVNLIDGLKNENIAYNTNLYNKYVKYIMKAKDQPTDGSWANWPYNLSEMKINDRICKEAKKESDTAIVVIGRSAGEERENKLEKGVYYLTDLEEEMIKSVTNVFDKTILVLNIGNIIDLSFTKKYNFNSIILAYQGGMESGNALARILSGKDTPSGKLTDSILNNFSDYPSSANFGNKDYNNYQEDIYIGYRYSNTFNKESILYPFGYGLSYTCFKRSLMSSSVTGTKYRFNILVENIGKYSGKDVVQVYVKSPDGKLGKPERVLVGYQKTKELLPSEGTDIEISFDLKDFASFDDSNATKNQNSYILEEGVYEFYLGSSSLDNELIYSYKYDKDIIVKTVNSIFNLSKDKLFDRIVKRDGKVHVEVVPYKKPTLKDRILYRIGEPIEQKEYNGETLSDVINGKISMDDFISVLSLDELSTISCGAIHMNSELGTKGNAGAIGGVSESLRQKGIPAVITSDGPAGVKIKSDATMMPIGTMVASTWNLELIEKLGEYYGEEIKGKDVDVILAPGMNIHRNPLCGRNFEYYSEDPLLSGLTAAAIIRGIEKSGVHATPKHFLCNNQEVNRRLNDSRCSERALREIYLKNFEVMLKNSNPRCIMTSYNMINSQHGHYDYDGCIEFMRIENGYTGMFMTDWWMEFYTSPEFELISGNAYRIRSGANVLMPGENNYGSGKLGNTCLENYDKNGGITLFELQQNARYILELCANTLAYKRLKSEK